MKILLIEDNEMDKDAIIQVAKQSKTIIDIISISKLSHPFTPLNQDRFDCVLIGCTIPQSDCIGMIRTVKSISHSRFPIVVVGSEEKEEIGLNLIKYGAHDYIIKNQITSTKLMRTLTYAIERHKTHCRLIHRETAIAKTDRKTALGIMIAGLAHNLNNPLAAVSGRLQILQRFSKNDESMASLVEELKKSINRVASIVNDMLNMSRSQSNDFMLTNVSDIVEESLALFNTLHEKKEIKYTKKIRENTVVYCCSPDIIQTLIHIYNNALDAMGYTGELSICAYQDNDAVIVEIKDTGIGITHENHQRMFDPFFTTKTGIAARGLGLSVVERIMERHQGSVTVDSSIGEGTRVRLLFPKVSDRIINKYFQINQS